jgi:hypothetical protein
MAWVNGGKKFGQYTYEHWFDHLYGNESNSTKNEKEIDKKDLASIIEHKENNSMAPKGLKNEILPENRMVK